MRANNPLITIGWYRIEKPGVFWFGEEKPSHFDADEGVAIQGRLISDISDKDELIGDFMSVDEWLECVECGGFIDYDGYGDQVIYHPDKALYYMVERQDRFAGLYPSEADSRFLFTTHIVWYNR